jgi:hypothetical protein
MPHGLSRSAPRKSSAGDRSRATEARPDGAPPRGHTEVGERKFDRMFSQPVDASFTQRPHLHCPLTLRSRRLNGAFTAGKFRSRTNNTDVHQRATPDSKAQLNNRPTPGKLCGQDEGSTRRWRRATGGTIYQFGATRPLTLILVISTSKVGNEYG